MLGSRWQRLGSTKRLSKTCRLSGTLGDWPRDRYLELRLQCLLVAKARHSYLLPL